MKCEGYLFPDTYEFLKDDTVHHYVATFYAHFDKQITDAMYKQLDEQGMTLPGADHAGIVRAGGSGQRPGR